MKIFCFDCNRLICRDCTVDDHIGHNFKFLKKCAPESRKTLCDSLAPLRKVQADIARAEKNLNATEAQVDTQKNEVCKSLEQSFDQPKVLLDQRKVELVEMASVLAQEKKDALAAQRKGLQVAQAEIQSLVEFVERNVENTSDHDLMGIRTQLQTKVEEEEKRHQPLCLVPATTADIVCNLPCPDIIPRELGAVFTQSNVPSFTVAVPSTASVGECLTFAMVIPQYAAPNVTAELRSLVDSSCIVRASIACTGGAGHSISFTPRVRGRHDLIVRVNGCEIPGSPFRLSVKIHPSLLGLPVRTITGVDRPYGITVSCKQELVIIERFGKKVKGMERDGKLVTTILCGDFNQPYGVTTGPDGAVYVSDASSRNVFKFNRAGILVRVIENELIKPYFITMIQNQLYVSCYKSNQIKVFDTDCNVLGTIHTESPQPYGMAQGKDGLLYVAGSGKIAIYECTPNGKFIRYFNTKPASMKLLELRGICFDSSGNLFVAQAEAALRGVYVFQPSGELVASFGLACSGPGGVEWPRGIAIDDDGFVYVCDYAVGRNKVVTF